MNLEDLQALIAGGEGQLTYNAYVAYWNEKLRNAKS